MGMNLTSMSKILKCAANDDIITIKAQVNKFSFSCLIFYDLLKMYQFEKLSVVPLHVAQFARGSVRNFKITQLQTNILTFRKIRF